MTILIKKAIIYLIEHNNYPNIKYVGQTKNELNKKWNYHLSSFKQFNRMYYRLYFYVNYYGVENFTIREYKIYNNITREFLNDEEKKYIFEIGTLNTRDSNNNITIKITNELRNELIKKLINQNVNISNLYKVIDTFSYDYKRDVLDFNINDENKILLNDLLKKEITSKFTNTSIDDYIKYINYFHTEFEITNSDNDNDIYYSSDLIYGLEIYRNKNNLVDFKNILQYYFINILNVSYDNIYINLNNNILYGIKKKISISFELYNGLCNLIFSFLENVNYNFNDFIDYYFNDVKSTNYCKIDKLFIEELDKKLYIIWKNFYIKKIKYDTENNIYDGSDDFIIMDNMDYSYDYNNLSYISNNLKSIIEKNNRFTIIDEKYIMLKK